MKKLLVICFILLAVKINAGIVNVSQEIYSEEKILFNFHSNYNPFLEGIMFSGRMSFYNPSTNYTKSFETGDVVGFFTQIGNICFGISDKKHDDWSWYVNLKMNRSYLNVDYYALAYNSNTKTIWKTEIMGLDLDNNRIHLRANQEIPEPSTFMLLIFGGLLLKRKRKRKLKWNLKNINI